MLLLESICRSECWHYERENGGSVHHPHADTFTGSAFSRDLTNLELDVSTLPETAEG